MVPATCSDSPSRLFLQPIASLCSLEALDAPSRHLLRLPSSVRSRLCKRFFSSSHAPGTPIGLTPFPTSDGPAVLWLLRGRPPETA